MRRYSRQTRGKTTLRITIVAKPMISPSRYTFVRGIVLEWRAFVIYVGIFIPLYKIPTTRGDARMKYLKDSSMFTSAPAQPWDFRAAESIRAAATYIRIS